MVIKVRKVSNFNDIQVVFDDCTVNLGMLDIDDGIKLAKHLIEVAGDLLNLPPDLHVAVIKLEESRKQSIMRQGGK
jgi:hypothetical protein